MAGKGQEDDIRRESEFLFRCYSDPIQRNRLERAERGKVMALAQRCEVDAPYW
jgi:hypothetical protein